MKHFFNIRFVLSVVAVLSLSNCHVENKNMVIQSPDGNIKVIVEMQNNIPFYTVSQKWGEVIEPSPLGLELSKPFEGGFRIVSSSTKSFDGWWEPVYGEYSKIRDHYNSLEIALEEKEGLQRRLNIVFRIYNEGLAFRYVVPEQGDSANWQITKELSTFKFPLGSNAYPIYRTEQPYSNVPVEINKVDSGAFMPFTVQLKNGFASLMEANVVNYPRARLAKTEDDSFVIDIYGEAKLNAPFETPWRSILTQLAVNPNGILAVQ